jgi:hypothetical protein
MAVAITLALALPSFGMRSSAPAEVSRGNGRIAFRSVEGHTAHLTLSVCFDQCQGVVCSCVLYPSNRKSITAPFAGNISDVVGANGIGVEAGASLMSVTATISDLSKLTFVTFVPQEVTALYANTGNIAIRYQTAKGQSEEISGSVTFVSDSPADPDSILSIVGGQDRLTLLTQGKEVPLYQVTVAPQENSEIGTAELPSVGKVVTLFNLYADPRPIDLLFGDE